MGNFSRGATGHFHRDADRRILGLHPGTTENATVCASLLEELVGRGLDPKRRRLVIVDGGKGLAKAVQEVFHGHAEVQRCLAHKIRGIRGALPDAQWPWVRVQLGLALGAPDGERAKQRLEVLATRLKAQGYGKAAGALREGLEELVAVNRLGLSPEVRRLLRTTNPLESAFSQCGRQAQRVRRWQNGAQVVRWVAFGLWRVQGAFRPLLTAAQMEEVVRALERTAKRRGKEAA